MLVLKSSYLLISMPEYRFSTHITFTNIRATVTSIAMVVCCTILIRIAAWTFLTAAINIGFILVLNTIVTCRH